MPIASWRPSIAARTRRAGAPHHRPRAFYGLDLLISPATLEPRPDTETLVESMLPLRARLRAAQRPLPYSRSRHRNRSHCAGAARRVAEATATGVDISAEALATAARNAEPGTWRSLRSRSILTGSKNFGAVGCNCLQSALYSCILVWQDLAREVREHEPLSALDGGPDGLDAYRRIGAQAREFLEADGRIGLEIGFDQKRDVDRVVSRARVSIWWTAARILAVTTGY